MKIAAAGGKREGGGTKTDKHKPIHMMAFSYKSGSIMQVK